MQPKWSTYAQQSRGFTSASPDGNHPQIRPSQSSPPMRTPRRETPTYDANASNRSFPQCVYILPDNVQSYETPSPTLHSHTGVLRRCSLRTIPDKLRNLSINWDSKTEKRRIYKVHVDFACLPEIVATFTRVHFRHGRVNEPDGGAGGEEEHDEHDDRFAASPYISVLHRCREEDDDFCISIVDITRIAAALVSSSLSEDEKGSFRSMGKGMDLWTEPSASRLMRRVKDMGATRVYGSGLPREGAVVNPVVRTGRSRFMMLEQVGLFLSRWIDGMVRSIVSFHLFSFVSDSSCLLTLRKSNSKGAECFMGIGSERRVRLRWFWFSATRNFFIIADFSSEILRRRE
jgi:hypothetical protein